MLFRGVNQTRTEGPSPSSETACRMVRPKGEHGGRVAFASRAARASEAARIYIYRRILLMTSCCVFV